MPGQNGWSPSSIPSFSAPLSSPRSAPAASAGSLPARTAPTARANADSSDAAAAALIQQAPPAVLCRIGYLLNRLLAESGGETAQHLPPAQGVQHQDRQ